MITRRSKKSLGRKAPRKAAWPSRGFTPRRSFSGQNFLRSPNIAQALVEAAHARDTDIIVEVGPGRGAVTEALLPRAKKVIAVEKDKNLVEYLKEKFSEDFSRGKLVLIHDDILNFDPLGYPSLAKRSGAGKLPQVQKQSLVRGGQTTPSTKAKLGTGQATYKLIGSLPYYITSRFLRIFLSRKFQPQTIALIIQKEVAERIMAKNGKESLLSLSVKAYGTPKYIKTIKAGSFYPKPKVDSAILVIENISKCFFQKPQIHAERTQNNAGFLEEEKFFQLLKIGFSSKRKKLLGNLKEASKKNPCINPGINTRILEEAGISPDIRAEDLSLVEWKRLYLRLMS